MDFYWLQTEVNNYAGDIILITHVPIDDSERFNTEELSRFRNIISNKVKLHIFGHKHGYSFKIEGNTPYFGMTQNKDGEFSLVNYN